MIKKLLLCALIIIFSFPDISFAAVNLPWSTTFSGASCPGGWTQTNGLSEATVNCDSLRGWGSWSGDNGDGTRAWEQITTLANNSFGGGGSGQRHWQCDGINSNSGGLWIEWTPAQPELWMRWYMRYQAGFQWNPLSYDKILYFDVNAKNEAPLFKNTDVIVEWYGATQSRIHVQSVAGGQSLHSASGVGGWPSTMGGAGGDGLWHYYEVHLKMDTNGSNGVGEMWIDGTRVINYNTVNFGTYNGWTYVLIGSNQRNPNNGSCFAVDFDDIKVSTTGYIGPISGGATPDTIPPSAPNGLSVS